MSNLDDFMCIHGEEELKKCQDIRTAVKEHFGCDDTNLVSVIVYSMIFDFEFNITEIGADQWMGITAESFTNEYNEGEGYPVDRPKIYVECDLFEDGIARIWQILNERYGEG